MNHPKSQLQALVFDFDGTIADTMEQARRILNIMAQRHQFRMVEVEDLDSVREMSMRAFIKFVGVRKRAIPAYLAEGRKMLHERMDAIEPIAGMPEVLRSLREELPTMGIVTSNSVDNVRTFLRAHDLDFFDFISSVTKLTGKHKYLKAVRRVFTLEPEQLIYVGDETRDIAAATRAGIPVAAVSWGFNTAAALNAEEPGYLLHEPGELLDLARKQCAGEKTISRERATSVS